MANEFRLIPREEKFYQDFLAMAEHICEAARALEEMVSSNPPDAAKTERIKELEHRCDFLTHEIIQRLHRTFVTPIDREDIHELAKAMDDVMDAIDASAHLFAQYRIEVVRDGARKFYHITVSATEQIRSALAHMEKRESREDLRSTLTSLIKMLTSDGQKKQSIHEQKRISPVTRLPLSS